MKRPAHLSLVLLAMSCAQPVPATTSSLSGVATLAGEQRSDGIDVKITGPVSLATTTDESGRYAFEQLPVGTYVITAIAPSTVERVQQTTVDLAAPVIAPRLSFSPLGALRGTVTLGGVGLTGVLVSSTGGPAVSLSDDAGHFEFKGLRAGTVQLTAARPGYVVSTREAQVAWAQTLELSPITMSAAQVTEATSAVRGIATLLGATDFSGISVKLKNAQAVVATTTDVDGRYALTHVPPGVYSLSFSKGDYWEHLPEVLASPGTDGQLLDYALYPLPALQLGRGRRVEGCQYSSWYVVTRDGLYVSCLFRGFSTDDFPTEQQLRLISVPDGQRTTISTFGAGASFSPDGSRMVFFEGARLDRTYTAKLVAVPAGRPVELMKQATSAWFSPDSATVLVQRASRELAAFPVAGGAPVQLGTDVRATPLWSPDSKHVLVAEGTAFPPTRVRVVALNGAQVAELQLGTARVLEWSRDEKNLLVFDGDKELKVLPMSGAPAVSIASNVLWSRLSRDGSKVFAVTGPGYGWGDLKVFPIGGGAPTDLAPGVFVPSLALSPDETLVTFRTLKGTTYPLEVMPTTGGPRVVLDSHEEGHLPPAVFSPDGSKLLFTRSDNFGPMMLVLVSSRGGAVVPLAQGAYYVNENAWVDNTHAWASRYAKDEAAFSNGVYVFSNLAVP